MFSIWIDVSYTSRTRENEEDLIMDILTLGQRIRIKRKELGMTQDELANEVGVVRPIISSYETGKIKPPIDKIVKLEKALKFYNKELLIDDSIIDEVPREYFKFDLVSVDDILDMISETFKSLDEDQKVELCYKLQAFSKIELYKVNKYRRE